MSTHRTATRATATRAAAAAAAATLVAVLGTISLVACSGATAQLGPADGGDAGVTDGGDTDGGTGDGGACTVAPLTLTRACVPGTAKAGVALSLDVDAEGCLGCGTTMLPCQVSVAGTTVRLELDARTCPLPEGTGCPAVCELPRAKCAIPPLAAGTYDVELGSGVKTSGDPLRKLVVKDDATATSCTIPTGAADTKISASAYPDTCGGDEDCATVTEGDTCQPCTCPNEAIAKTSLDAYQAELRAKQSLCMTKNGGPVCGPCKQVVAKCSANRCVAVTP